jgi:hypothetical protein
LDVAVGLVVRVKDVLVESTLEVEEEFLPVTHADSMAVARMLPTIVRINRLFISKSGNLYSIIAETGQALTQSRQRIHSELRVLL